MRSGEILGLIGPNGAGKTTMFNLLAGALKLSAGEIAFSGKSVVGRRQRQIARSGVARTFQHVKLRPNMTVVENVMLGTYTRTSKGFSSAALKPDKTEEASAFHEAYGRSIEWRPLSAASCESSASP